MQSLTPIIKTVAEHLVPVGLYHLLFPSWFRNYQTIRIERGYGIGLNDMFQDAEIYLRDKIVSSTKCFKVHKTHRQKELSTSIGTDVAISDTFQGNKVTWTLRTIQPNFREMGEKMYFELTFKKKFHLQVLHDYLPFVEEKARGIRDTEKVVKLSSTGDLINQLGCIDMDHPATFETLVMDPVKKKELIADLDTFTRREHYYKRIGRAWKRGYLLYGPPGTGKSSLVAAMANYLKYDVYEVELTSLLSNSDFRQTLLSTGNRSIIVIEDIDCTSEEFQNRRSAELKRRRSVELQNWGAPISKQTTDAEWTLSGLSNFLDGLWSSCGDERIFVFTTNHKDRLDPALFRPGRIDMEISMTYCKMDGFRSLARNYLDISDSDHPLFTVIEDLITNVKVTPAEVSGELMRSQNVDIALEGLVDFLKRKKEEPIRTATEEEESSRGPESQQAKKRRIETKEEVEL
ncbi:hypothetical protein LguiA_008531 [Lonicera macranthoides]